MSMSTHTGRAGATSPAVHGRQQDDLRDVAERVLLLPEEEGHRLMERDAAGRSDGHEDGGQQG